jgi:hypothetical protein
MPLLSKDDNIPTRLSRAAYLFALREWRRLGGVGRAFEGADCGVLQLARDERHAGVQQEALATWNYPQEYARWADAQEASPDRRRHAAWRLAVRAGRLGAAIVAVRSHAGRMRRPPAARVLHGREPAARRRRMAGARCRRRIDRASADRHPRQRRRRQQHRAGGRTAAVQTARPGHAPAARRRAAAAAAGGLPRSL